MNEVREYSKRIDSGPAFARTLIGETLGEDAKARVYVPENPLIPTSEGTHIRVAPKEGATSPKAKLKLWQVGLGVAKVVVEGRSTSDMWVNLMMGEEWSGDRPTLDVFGRKPEGTHWEETLPYTTDPDFDHNISPIKPQLANLKAVWQRYYRMFWEPRFKDMALFPQGIQVVDPQSEAFAKLDKQYQERPYPWQEEVMWANDKYVVVVILHPHIKSGIHFVVHPREESKRAWGDFARSLERPTKEVGDAHLRAEVNKNLEGVAIAMGVAELIKKKGIAAHTSIRVTNSWSGDFREPDILKGMAEGGVTKPLKRAKRKWRRTDFHPHIYGARHADESIRTTTRPRHEGGKDWEGIEPMIQGERQRVKSALNAELTSWLTRHCQGLLKT